MLITTAFLLDDKNDIPMKQQRLKFSMETALSIHIATVGNTIQTVNSPMNDTHMSTYSNGREHYSFRQLTPHV